MYINKMCSTESPTNNNNNNNKTAAIANDNNNNMDTTLVNSNTTNSPNSPNNNSVTINNTNNNRNPNRRSNKPIMEKRRRARINNCLNELKAILLEAMKKDPARHSKLEKADILEMTVSHLQSLHKNPLPINNTSDNNRKYREGFSECASEVNRFLSSPKATGISPITSQRLMSHLSDCLNNVTNSMILSSPGSLSPPPPLLCHNGPPSNEQQHHNLLGISPSNMNTPIHISLVPSRLSSGEIAFVVPANAIPGVHNHNQSSVSVQKTYSQSHNSPMPMGMGVGMSMLSPSDGPLELTMHSACPTATSSPSSTTSSLSPVSYHHPPPTHHPYYHQNHYHSPQTQQPLALVTPRYEDTPLDMSCWRPW